MPKLPMLFFTLVLLPAMAGCGTMANLDGRKLAIIDFPHQEAPTPFGGVRRDIGWICSGAVFFIADVPCSLVGDIVTLPKVLRAKSEGYEIWDFKPNPPLHPTEAAIPVSPEAKTASGGPGG